MAITTADAGFWRLLRHRGILPKSPSLLEVGEANWYGDIPLDVFRNWMVSDGRMDLAEDLDELLGADLSDVGYTFLLGRMFYRLFVFPSLHDSWDLHGTPASTKVDLNLPNSCSNRYDVVVNNGTLEHIFNIGNAFRTIHQVTAPGGLMVHGFPYNGWPDHGFYSVEPTLFADLASANGYAIEAAAVGSIYAPGKPAPFFEIEGDLCAWFRENAVPRDVILFVAFRKTGDSDFAMPMQNIYSERPDPVRVLSWRKDRP